MFDAFELFLFSRIREFSFCLLDAEEFPAYLVSENLMLRPKSCVVVG